VLTTWDWLDSIAGTLDDDFIEAVTQEPPPTQPTDFKRLFR